MMKKTGVRSYQRDFKMGALGSLPEPWLSELSELSDKLSDCRTLSDSCQR